LIFIDTGAFLARYLAKDQCHVAAVAGWKSLGATKIPCFTSNFVLDELFTLLGRRAGYSFAADRARAIYSSNEISILRPDRNDEIEAIGYMEKFSDQKVSYTDCVSFRLMKSQGIKSVFGFDRHFEYAGFELWRWNLSN
jgi:predicted nucleic acid-binding protein